ncbi:MAG: Hsp20/alpha crystallin family protein [Planctomycetes bacterium]|nr:Hsp20/alpha crystallin family protein [Planctomycetota bacterium]
MDCMIPFRRRAAGSSTAAHSRHPNTLFDRMVNDLFGESWLVVPGRAASDAGAVDWLPALDLKEEEEQITVRVELPGVDAKDVDVELHDDVLVLSGKKEEQHEEKEGGRLWSERRYGAFRRELQLPAPVAADSVKASCAKGVLTVTLQKAKSAAGRKIPVEAR